MKNMSQNFKVGLIMALIVIIILASLGVAWLIDDSKTYVAKVNGEKIKNYEYEFFLKDEKMRVEQQEQEKNTDMSKYWTTEKQKEARDAALVNAQKFKIQYQKAKEAKISLTNQEVANIKSQINQIISGIGGQDQADAQLKSYYGVSLEEYQAIMTDMALIQKFIDQTEKKIAVSDDEIQKYYDQNKDSIDTVTVRHILIKTTDSDGKELPADKVKEAKAKAEDLMKQVKSGADMAKLAEEKSEDTSAKDNKGEFTFSKKNKDNYVTEFANWPFGKNVGEIGLIKSKYGYHVMKLEAKSDTLNDKAKETVKLDVQKDKFTKELDAWSKESKYKPVINKKVYDSIVF